MSDRYFVDTNVLVYAHDSSEKTKSLRARQLILAGLRDETLVLSAQVLSEFFVTITQKIKVPLSSVQAREELELLRAAEIVDIDADLVLEAVDLRRKHKLSYWDGLIVAAAQRARCPRLYSEDMSGGAHIAGVEIVNPFQSAVEG
jgi:predicted nucleic acid-binding protein